MGIPKFPKLGLLWFWRLITLCADLRLRWGLKQGCSSWWKLSNNMWHATFTQGNRGDSWLLVVEKSKIDNLTFDLFFGHNLCFKYSNGSCEFILDIYVLRYFQWYKELFNSMNFDACNRPLKIRESIGTPIPKMGAHLGVWGFIPSHFFTLLRIWNVIPGLTLSPHLCKPLPWSWAQGQGYDNCKIPQKKFVTFSSIFLAIIKSHRKKFIYFSSFGHHQIPRKKLVTFSFLLTIVKSHEKTYSLFFVATFWF
jgi:hypothetical protein